MIDDLIYRLAALIRTAFKIDAKKDWELVLPLEQKEKPEPTFELATPNQVCQFQHVAGWMLVKDNQQLQRWKSMNQAYALKILEVVSTLDGDKIIRFTKPFFVQIITAIKNAGQSEPEAVIRETIQKYAGLDDASHLVEIVNVAARNGAIRFENYDKPFIETLAKTLKL